MKKVVKHHGIYDVSKMRLIYLENSDKNNREATRLLNSNRIKCHQLLVKSGILLVVMILAFSCARKEYFPPPDAQTGLASWYGPKFHGKTTSSREIYNMYDMTAAHRALPFGTHVMVTNLDNGKSVVVRINDRGPFIKGRIIDLSFAAAKVLDMIGSGVVPVIIEVLETPLLERDESP